MLAYGFKTGRPWAEDRRALGYAFYEQDAQNNRSHTACDAPTRIRSDLHGGRMLNTMSPIASRRRSAAYLYPNAGDVDSDGEAPSVRLDQSSSIHNARAASDSAFIGRIILDPRHEERCFHSSRRSAYGEDVGVSPRHWEDHTGSSHRDDFPEPNGDPHSRQDMDSDWEDGHQGDGSGGSTGMFDYGHERWLAFSEYDDHHECDLDSEGDYDYESGSEASENESHYGSESDVGSDWSYDVYYYDSD